MDELHQELMNERAERRFAEGKVHALENEVDYLRKTLSKLLEGDMEEP